MIFRTGRYSGFIRPISYVLDLSVVHLIAVYCIGDRLPAFNFVVFISLAWLIISFRINFYEIYRFTHVTKILTVLTKQAILFGLVVFAFFGFYSDLEVPATTLFQYVLLTMGAIALIKFSIFFLLKKYRRLLRGNIRRVVIIGLNQKTDQLRKFFDDFPQYGYQLKQTFDIQGPEAVSLKSALNTYPTTTSTRYIHPWRRWTTSSLSN